MTPDQIIAEVARVVGVRSHEIRSSKRTRVIAWAKFIATRELKRLYPHWTHQKLAEELGGNDPSTARHRLTNADWLEATNPDFRAITRQLWPQILTTPPAPK